MLPGRFPGTAGKNQPVPSGPTSPTPPRIPAPAPRALGVMLLAAALALALAGCGSSHVSGTSADPALAVPASTPLYAGVTVRPRGAEQAAALAAGRALTHQSDPYLRLPQALQTPGSATLNYKRDVAPWLGPHAAVFLSSLTASGSLLSLLQQGLLGGSAGTGAFPFGAGGAQGAIVLDTSDASKAGSFLKTQASRAGAHPAAYRGVAYELTANGLAFAVVDRFAVIGSEAGLHSVIDTTLGGPSMAHAAGYSRLLASAPAGALAHIYTNPSGSATRTPAEQQGLAGLLALLTGTREANISLIPSAGSIALDADAPSSPSGASGSSGGLLASGPQGAQTFSELPGESWLAVGLGDVATTLSADVQGLRGLASIADSSAEGSTSSTFSLKGLLEGLFTPLGVMGADTAQARRDFQSWMGTAGIFASGASLLELRAAVVIESKQPARSRAAVAELAARLRAMGASTQPATIAGADAAIGARLRGLPVILDIADGQTASGHRRFVLGLGEASVTAALNPSSTLAGTDIYHAASGAVGEGIRPSVLFDFRTFLSLLEQVGLLESPTISGFVPYLRNLITLTGGGQAVGASVERYRLVLELNASAGG
jgi:Protein of unknown function (DUF3352)